MTEAVGMDWHPCLVSPLLDLYAETVTVETKHYLIICFGTAEVSKPISKVRPDGNYPIFAPLASDLDAGAA